MALSELTDPDAVRQAMAEFDRRGNLATVLALTPINYRARVATI